MNIKSLLLGSAAALAAVSGAQAADAIIAAEPEPMEYVRVCDAFGTGYFYIPGTETCLKIDGYVRFQVDFDSRDGAYADDNWDAFTRARVNFTSKSDTELGELTGYIGMQINTSDSPTFGALQGTGSTNAFTLDEVYLQLGGFKAGTYLNWLDKGINGETDQLASVFGTRMTSIAYIYTGDAFTGNGSQEITLVRTSAASSVVRHVSGSGVPTNNRVDEGGVPSALAPYGFVGFLMKTTEADLQVYMGLDDGASSGGTVGLERSMALPAIADGEWHLYEWNLADPNVWSNFSGGNGMIDGPNAYIDSIFFQSGASTAGTTFSVLIDTVAYNPNGSLAALFAVPEPSTIVLSLTLAGMLPRRAKPQVV